MHATKNSISQCSGSITGLQPLVLPLVRDAISGYVYSSAEASDKAATGDLDGTSIYITMYEVPASEQYN